MTLFPSVIKIFYQYQYLALQPHVCESNYPPEAAVSIAANGETLSCFPLSRKKIRIESTFLLSPKALLTISHLSQADQLQLKILSEFSCTDIYHYIKIAPCFSLYTLRHQVVLVLTATSTLCCCLLLPHGLSENEKQKQFFHKMNLENNRCNELCFVINLSQAFLKLRAIRVIIKPWEAFQY